MPKMTMIRKDGTRIVLFDPDEMEWHAGEPLPHLRQDFSDPPGAATQEHFREVLIMGARVAPDLVVLVEALLNSLGTDLVKAHNVPPEVAGNAVVEFATWLWNEYHEET